MPGQFASWGAESMGSRLWEQDQAQAALQDLAMRLGEQDLAHSTAMAPLQQEQARTLAQTQAIKLKQAQLEQQLLEDWQSQQTGAQPSGEVEEGEDVAGLSPQALARLESRAEMLMRIGKTNEAKGLLATITQAHARQASIDQRRATQAKAEFERQKATAEAALGFIRGANSQADWDAARMSFVEQYGVDLPVFSQPFSPELRARALQQGLTEVQAATIENQKKMQSVRERELGLRARQVEAQVELARARVADVKERTKLRAKTGDKAPNKADLAPATALIRQQFPDLANDPTELGLMSASVASQARMLVRANPALSYAQAVAEALESQRSAVEEVTNGVTSAANSLTFGMVGSRKFKFNLTGRTPTTALPAPASGKAADLRVGMWYKDDDGLVGRWTGKGFEYLPAGRTSSNTDDDDEED